GVAMALFDNIVNGGNLWTGLGDGCRCADSLAAHRTGPATHSYGYHLCYGSPADDHVIQPKDAGIMVEIVNAVSTGVLRPIQFFHLPVPKPRTDDAYFAPLAGLKLRPETQ